MEGSRSSRSGFGLKSVPTDFYLTDLICSDRAVVTWHRFGFGFGFRFGLPFGLRFDLRFAIRFDLRFGLRFGLRFARRFDPSVPWSFRGQSDRFDHVHGPMSNLADLTVATPWSILGTVPWSIGAIAPCSNFSKSWEALCRNRSVEIWPRIWSVRSSFRRIVSKSTDFGNSPYIYIC